MKKSLIKSEKTIFILFGIIALIISSIIALILSNNLNKYDFVKYKEFFEGKEFNITSHYYDLNNDGLSERIPVAKIEEKKNSWLQIHNVNGDVKDQFNFWQRNIYSEKTSHNTWMSVEDLDNDGIKEIFIASMEKDSLFLNIISTKDSKFILKDRLIYIRKNIRRKRPWDIQKVIGKTIDVNNDGSKDLLLSFGTGYSLQPRGFMTYDIKNDSIIDTFYTKASFTDISIVDIDGDGEEEILCRSGSGGNYSDSTGYPDTKAWFFVLNKDLSFKLPPRSYGQMQTSIKYVIMNSEIIIIATGINDSLDAVYERISSKGELLERKTFKKLGNGRIQPIYQNGKLFFVSKLKNKPAILYDKTLNVILKKESFGSFYFAADLTNDGVKELLFKYKKTFIITNQEFNTIAKLKIDENTSVTELVLLGKGKQNGLAIQTENANIIYILQESILNKYFILLLLLLSVFLFFIFIGFHKLLKQVSIFYHTFLFFITQGDSSLLLLNQNGIVLKFNTQFEKLFLKKKIEKRIHFNKMIKNYENISEIISDSIKTETSMNEELSIYKKDISFKGKIEVIPFKSFLGYTFAYLVRIIDQTDEIINERIQVWSHTAQKIAHEIKTPLGSIQLNLKALKKRLERDKKTDFEIDDDIFTIDEQINRIKSLTSSFLKITNVEKSSSGLYSLKSLLDNAIKKFSGYLKNGINITIDKNIDEVEIIFDKNQFVEAIQIILENSIDALEGKGNVTITITMRNISEIELLIIDFGKGIDITNINKVFDPYYTTKKEGTGLGLAFAKKIIEDNNSSIEVESKLTKWTKIKLKIPIA